MCISSIEFDDDKKIVSVRTWVENYVEHEDYRKLKKQCEADSHHNWGDNLNALIMSDRCPGRAKGLYEYLNKKTNLSSVKLCKTLDEAKNHISRVPINILVFVGYQENESNYEIKKLLKEKNPAIFTVKYAFLDSFIEYYCINNKIKYAFSSERPVADFIDYLKESYTIHNLIMLKTKKKSSFLDAI